MKAHILYYNYLTPDGARMSIGGIQTYITNLLPILEEAGYEVVIHQRADHDFTTTIGNTTIHGIQYTAETWGSQVSSYLIEQSLPYIQMTEDILIYGCETCITRRMPMPTIAIQHGIFWDVEDKSGMSKLQYFKKELRRIQTSWQVTRRVAMVDKLVCVDHNFVNWHRAICVNTGVHHIVIPNFSQIPQQCPDKGNESDIKIIFARRFFIHRGTRIFSHAIAKIVSEYPQINVTIAGDGPDAPYMHKQLDRFTNIHFTQYTSDESMAIHADKHIAVVPTTGSEGTSLSLLEAMSSACAVICTNVGGMTNIVLDHYNGLMINPDEESLYLAMKTLIEDSALRKRLQQNAYATARDAFSLDLWKKRWRNVIQSVLPNRAN